MRSEARTPKGKKLVKATSQVLLEANPSRDQIVICNPSAKEVWLALGETAAKEEGLWLKKESGSIVILGWGGPIACITSEGEGTITYAEV